jgi:2-iminoacetate synthase
MNKNINPDIKIIDENHIYNLLEKSVKPDRARINEILIKAKELKGLKIEEVAALLNIEDSEDLEILFRTANFVKDEIYGKRIVLFAPLYISNYCANNCLYCGFRIENTEADRMTLSLDQIKEETLALLEQGHKRTLMLMGEDHQNCDLDYFYKAIDTVYGVKDSKGSQIRRINVEIQPLSEEEFHVIKDIKIGTYTVFQETYHRDTYLKMHPKGKKSNYDWRIQVMDRALTNGMHDVGIGTLFGLYDYKFEVLAMIQHTEHLEKNYGTGPHTISVPRIKPASNAPAAMNIPNQVSDRDFKKLVAILRMAVPYTGMILSTRESAELRTELIHMGISQISAGSKTNPGGYKQAFSHDFEESQFSLNDSRTSGEVIASVIEEGFVPSFCTSCYRKGRVGEDFMDLAKPGLIKLFCMPNSLMTLKEYLVDYADEHIRKVGLEVIEREIKAIPTENIQHTTREYLNKIECGDRDLYL